MKKFYDQVSLTLKEIAAKSYNLEVDFPLWEAPSRQEFGDLSTAVSLKIASCAGGNPLKVADEIQKKLAENFSREVERIEVIKPGFINLFFSKNFLIDALGEIIDKGKDYFKQKRKGRILIEFVSANPTGPLSVAHGRQAVVGDVIANIRKALGDNVQREYYLNDIGRQIDLFVLSVAERIKQLEKKKYKLPEGGYKGEYLKDIASDYLGKGNKPDLRTYCLDYIQNWIKKDLNRLDVFFDSWFSQKQLVEEKRVEEVIDILKKKSYLYEKEGALWFRSTQFLDTKDRVLRKSDGSLTYFASDIAYHYNKAKRGYGSLINLWGPDHHGYIDRIHSALKALGYKKELLTVVIIQLVSLKSKERMSKRAGTLIRFSELVEQVGKDAARFYYLTRKNSSHLDFDIDLAKKSSFDNPLYYIQYVCARIESIFEKAAGSADKKFNQYLDSPQELDIVRFIIQFSLYLQRSYYLLEPVFIIEYLRGLASVFHKFYEQVRVLGDDSDKTRARLNILQATKTVLHFGLEILGIKPVERM